MRNDTLKSKSSKSGAWGLAEDVRYYGDVMLKRAITGWIPLPQVKIPVELEEAVAKAKLLCKLGSGPEQ